MPSIRKTYRRIILVCVLISAGACSTVSREETRVFDREAATAGFREYVRTLADDRFEGRSPSSLGEARTLEYLSDVYRKLGLSAPSGSYLQKVPLVSVSATNVSDLVITSPDSEQRFVTGREAVVWTKQLTSSSQLSESPLVFAGYGIVAPEYQWDDYAEIDVRGKTVVVLVNDPGFASQDDALFNGNAMTYYGRWTYKFEEAARQGAAGLLIVHQTEAAGYPWQVVTGSWEGEQFDLVAADKNMSRAPVEGWISQRVAEKIFALSGREYSVERDAAARPGYRAIELDAKASVSFSNTIRESESNNVLGYIEGSLYPDETVIFTAHWDHLGMASTGDDRVFNGAQDNAAGIAAMLAIAAAMADGPAPERSVAFLAVTAEESGLLGSAWYGANPVFPLETTVAAINLDAPSLLGPTRDVSVVGFGSSQLEDLLRPYVLAQDRILAREPTPEKGFFYRSDHFNFSKRGVPVLYAKSGIDHREFGSDYGIEWNRIWVAERYHKVKDEYDPNWDLRGVAEDMELFFSLGIQLANSRLWPQWYEGNEFKRIRDESDLLRASRN